MKKNLLLIIVLALIFAVILKIFSGHEKVEKKPLYWVDSMEPTIHYQAPGKSRMGMELTPVYPEENQGNNNQPTVQISPTVVNNLGVRTAPVMQTALTRRIETVGYVEPNENKISHIHTYADGWVKKLVVKAVGDSVKKDQLLLQFYSPQLVTAQEEYLLAVEANNQLLINASYKRLQALHISEQQIQQLKTTRKSNQLVDIYSPQDGIVTALNIREGMRVTPEIEIMSLVDLYNIWMVAQVFEEQANWVKAGEAVEARLSAFPGKIWKGVVEYVYPELDPTTRAVKVRFRFDNPGNTLKPNMYANIALLAEPKQNVLSIPLEALIRSSEGDRVIVTLGNGRFQVRPVVTGMESGERVEIISGLKAGENVVVSGQFLLDSESNLKAGLERVETPTQNGNAQQSPVKPNKNIQGKGIIKAMNIAQHTLTLQHEAIPILNWPAMTMDFLVAGNVPINDFKIGDHIQFDLEKTNDNRLVITAIKKL